MPVRTNKKAIERRLGRVLRASFRRLGVKGGRVDIILASGAEMKRLYAAYYKKKRGNPRPTFSTKKVGRDKPDVLSFAADEHFPHPEVRGRFLGEIYLNKKFTADPARLEFLLIHGLLHLLGYSHTQKRDTLRMQALEKKLATRT